ncbi:TlpA family protein disulfide reductase [Gimesia fumaroli]|uniref:Uncharacterized protein n=1 Tax=Gimesia fumaroli TaxID=2527976 RepID=A0A518ICA4_9PLAN|nr:thioredoxin-like domain-containing protein [Gimesia fumaroli]QDV50738.1 hypothetical protein Enr17x_27810 [Gimesia fumaroli]
MKIFRILILTCVGLGFLDLAGAEEQGAVSSRKPRPQFKVGDAAPEFWGFHAGGEAYDYGKSFRGKTILLIFWSLEDPDHEQLNQRLRKIRRRFLDQQDFLMVSQCVDQDYEKWIAYCNRQKRLDGNAFYSDGKWIHQTQGGFNLDELNSAKEFGVTKTPAFFLLGPQRKFLAMNVPEKQLVKQIQTVLKSQTRP